MVLRALGGRGVARLQQWGGARMLFFPMVHLGGVACKYGVIETKDLVSDLEHWDTLYCAGRLHKPVRVLLRDERLEGALRTNLGNALRVSLLHTHGRAPGQPIAWRALFEGIASLSYAGDVRMGIGEDPNKVANIVGNNEERFRQLYQPFVDDLQKNGVITAPSSGIQVLDVEALKRMVPAAWHSPDSLRAIVRRVSAAQTAKGVISAGPYRSFLYALRKLQKRLL